MTGYPLTDTHCHLYFDWFDKDRDKVILDAKQDGLVRLMVPGIDSVSSKQAVDLSRKEETIYAAVGIHPNTPEYWSGEMDALFRELILDPKVKAIGEIGLDYYRDHVQPADQKKNFLAQLAFAEKHNLPVILHCREAEDDLLEIVAEWVQLRKSSSSPGVWHSFTGKAEHLKMAVELGFYIGINGIVTYKTAENLRDVVREIPQNRLLIETDAPFLSPQPRRGKRNQPANVKYINQRIAEILNIEPAELGTITTKNAEELFEW